MNERKMTKLPLIAKLLIKSNKTILDLKTEALLICCHSFFKQYDNAKNQVELLPDTEKGDSQIIEQTVSEIQNYLDTNIMKEEELRTIILNANSSRTKQMESELIKPVAIFFDSMLKIFNQNCKQNDEWIPELLGLSLIYQYRVEEEKSFKKFPLLNEFDLERVYTVYRKTDLVLKKNELAKKEADFRSQKRVYTVCPAVNSIFIRKQDKKVTIWGLSGPITKMMDLAALMIDALKASRYKIDETRVSKSRSKKRRR